MARLTESATTPRVKVCCISSVDEAMMAVRAGADALGLVSTMPSGPGAIPLEAIANIVSIVPESIDTFLLTSNRNSNDVAEQVEFTGVNTVQLVDSVDLDMYSELRSRCPNTKIVQVIHVLSVDSVREASNVDGLVDALLLDSGNPHLETKVLGGTGKTHNWQLSAEIVRRVRVPVFLAGGLHSGNVRAAIDTVRPDGVDLCTGVRTAGGLDNHKLISFFESVGS